jgi:UDP-N-acetylglucosamine 1-carboxyvinyltransferase
MIAGMGKIRVRGGASLHGEIRTAGSKHAGLLQMAASLLADGPSTLHNMPAVPDVGAMGNAMRELGCEVSVQDDSVTVTPGSFISPTVEYDSMRRLRNNFLLLGPLLARCGWARVAHPGSDLIGSRGTDMHISGLIRMGADVSVEHGFVEARAPRLSGGLIALDFPSVGTTGNLLMAAVTASGETQIDNAARDPEIVDLCDFLTAMGANIEGAGTYHIVVNGVEELKPVEHHIVGDHVGAATWAVAAVMTRGDVTIRGADPAHFQTVLEMLTAAHATVEPVAGGVRVRNSERPSAVDVATLPAPGYPSDVVPMAFGLASVSRGISMITENVFQGRFMFVAELARLGADIRTDGHHAVVRGRELLSGAPVRATDVRASAALVFAGLCGDSATVVSGSEWIDRAYPDFAQNLTALGAEVDLDPVD